MAGAVVRALVNYHCGPGSNPGVDASFGRSCFFVFLPCSERFFSVHSGFPLSPQKPPRPNSNSIWNARTRFLDKQISIFVDCCKLQNNGHPNFISPQVKEIIQLKRFFSLLPPHHLFPSFIVLIASF